MEHRISFWKSACTWIQTMSASGALMTSAKEVYLPFRLTSSKQTYHIRSSFQGHVTHLAAASPGIRCCFHGTGHGNESTARDPKFITDNMYRGIEVVQKLKVFDCFASCKTLCFALAKSLWILLAAPSAASCNCQVGATDLAGWVDSILRCKMMSLHSFTNTSKEMYLVYI